MSDFRNNCVVQLSLSNRGHLTSFLVHSPKLDFALHESLPPYLSCNTYFHVTFSSSSSSSLLPSFNPTTTTSTASTASSGVGSTSIVPHGNPSLSNAAVDSAPLRYGDTVTFTAWRKQSVNSPDSITAQILPSSKIRVLGDIILSTDGPIFMLDTSTTLYFHPSGPALKPFGWTMTRLAASFSASNLYAGDHFTVTDLESGYYLGLHARPMECMPLPQFAAKVPKYLGSQQVWLRTASFAARWVLETAEKDSRDIEIKDRQSDLQLRHVQSNRVVTRSVEIEALNSTGLKALSSSAIVSAKTASGEHGATYLGPPGKDVSVDTVDALIMVDQKSIVKANKDLQLDAIRNKEIELVCQSDRGQPLPLKPNYKDVIKQMVSKKQSPQANVASSSVSLMASESTDVPVRHFLNVRVCAYERPPTEDYEYLFSLAERLDASIDALTELARASSSIGRYLAVYAPHLWTLRAWSLLENLPNAVVSVPAGFIDLADADLVLFLCRLAHLPSNRPHLIRLVKDLLVRTRDPAVMSLVLTLADKDLVAKVVLPDEGPAILASPSDYDPLIVRLALFLPFDRKAVFTRLLTDSAATVSLILVAAHLMRDLTFDVDLVSVSFLRLLQRAAKIPCVESADLLDIVLDRMVVHPELPSLMIAMHPSMTKLLDVLYDSDSETGLGQRADAILRRLLDLPRAFRNRADWRELALFRNEKLSNASLAKWCDPELPAPEHHLLLPLLPRLSHLLRATWTFALTMNPTSPASPSPVSPLQKQQPFSQQGADDMMVIDDNVPAEFKDPVSYDSVKLLVHALLALNTDEIPLDCVDVLFAHNDHTALAMLPSGGACAEHIGRVLLAADLEAREARSLEEDLQYEPTLKEDTVRLLVRMCRPQVLRSIYRHTFLLAKVRAAPRACLMLASHLGFQIPDHVLNDIFETANADRDITVMERFLGRDVMCMLHKIAPFNGYLVHAIKDIRRRLVNVLVKFKREGRVDGDAIDHAWMDASWLEQIGEDVSTIDMSSFPAPKRKVHRSAMGADGKDGYDDDDDEDDVLTFDPEDVDSEPSSGSGKPQANTLSSNAHAKNTNSGREQQKKEERYADEEEMQALNRRSSAVSVSDDGDDMQSFSMKTSQSRSSTLENPFEAYMNRAYIARAPISQHLKHLVRHVSPTDTYVISRLIVVLVDVGRIRLLCGLLNKLERAQASPARSPAVDAAFLALLCKESLKWTAEAKSVLMFIISRYAPELVDTRFVDRLLLHHFVTDKLSLMKNVLLRCSPTIMAHMIRRALSEETETAAALFEFLFDVIAMEQPWERGEDAEQQLEEWVSHLSERTIYVDACCILRLLSEPAATQTAVFSKMVALNKKQDELLERRSEQYSLLLDYARQHRVNIVSAMDAERVQCTTLMALLGLTQSIAPHARSVEVATVELGTNPCERVGFPILPLSAKHIHPLDKRILVELSYLSQTQKMELFLERSHHLFERFVRRAAAAESSRFRGFLMQPNVAFALNCTLVLLSVLINVLIFTGEESAALYFGLGILLLIALACAHVVYWPSDFAIGRAEGRSSVYLEGGYLIAALVLAFLGAIVSEYWFSFHLVEIIRQVPLLLGVLQSVTRSGRSLLVTGLLAIILLYFFAVTGFLFLSDSLSCHNVPTCFAAVVQGLPSNGGTLAERMPNLGDELAFVLCFFVVAVIVSNITLGIIIDSFGELRQERSAVREAMKTVSFISGIPAQEFEKEGLSFEQHTKQEQPLLAYVHWYTYLQCACVPENRAKAGIDVWFGIECATPLERLCFERLMRKDITVYPLGRARSLELVQAAQGSSEEAKRAERLQQVMLIGRAVESVTSRLSMLHERLGQGDRVVRELAVQQQAVQEMQLTAMQRQEVLEKGQSELRDKLAAEEEARRKKNKR